jgi:dipeptidase D
MNFSEKILDFFTTVLCPTPRASYHEELIAGKLVDFAKDRGLKSFRDKSNNVIVYKPGTGKYIDTSIPVILQAHTDMICVPADADFSAGVEAYYSAENRMTGRSAVTKEKTSLGADDGIGVATILAVLDDRSIVHPPLVAIFTAEEECGLTGAMDISADDIVGIAPGLDFGRAAFINLDNGHFGEFSVGCAGSTNVVVKVPVMRMQLPPPLNSSRFELAVCGLTGGHSGLSIHEKRGNANILLCSAIRKLYSAEVDLQILGLGRCGDASNAIPSTASACVAIPSDHAGMLREAAAKVEAEFKEKYRDSDGGVRLEVRESGEFNDEMPYSALTVSNLTLLAEKVDDGPIAYSAAVPGLVETSSNLGIMKDEGDHIAATFMVRSSIDAAMERAVEEIHRHANYCHADIEVGSRSPGWAYKEKSPLRDLFLSKYKEMFGEEAAAVPVHAGLECGHFAEKFRRFEDMDFISCGPTSTGIHSVDETLHTETVEKFGRLLIEALGNLYS